MVHPVTRSSWQGQEVRRPKWLTLGGRSTSVGAVVPDPAANTGTVTAFLDRVSARSPNPAGGCVAALGIAQAAAVVAMGARYCDAPSLVEQAERLVARGVQLVGDDE